MMTISVDMASPDVFGLHVMLYVAPDTKATLLLHCNAPLEPARVQVSYAPEGSLVSWTVPGLLARLVYTSFSCSCVAPSLETAVKTRPATMHLHCVKL